MYHSNHSDDYLLHLTLRGKQEKNYNAPKYKIPTHFQGSEQKLLPFEIELSIFSDMCLFHCLNSNLLPFYAIKSA